MIIAIIVRFNSGKKNTLMRRLSLGKSVSTMHKYKSVSDSRLNDLKTRCIIKRTYNKMQWGVYVYNTWKTIYLSSPIDFGLEKPILII